jgi:hexulose-6-phosphate isomerase
MTLIGIMQGRLSPPAEGKIQSFPKLSWREEFHRAPRAGISHIEWIYEADEVEKNPLSTSNGVLSIVDVVRESGTQVISVCADYFMDVPYLQASAGAKKELSERLEWLVARTNEIGGRYIDLPFVDASAIKNSDQFPALKEFVSPALTRAAAVGVTIALETSLNPGNFKELLLFVGHPNLMANYDSGNSASLGYDCEEELSTYGAWIRTVHIKDRELGGSTVPLGTGNASFPVLFQKLHGIGYSGPFVLQAAREGDEIKTAEKNVAFVRHFLQGGPN